MIRFCLTACFLFLFGLRVSVCDKLVKLRNVIFLRCLGRRQIAFRLAALGIQLVDELLVFFLERLQFFLLLFKVFLLVGKLFFFFVELIALILRLNAVKADFLHQLAVVLRDGLHRLGAHGKIVKARGIK